MCHTVHPAQVIPLTAFCETATSNKPFFSVLDKSGEEHGRNRFWILTDQQKDSPKTQFPAKIANCFTGDPEVK